jgi:hypothetical protein
VPRVGKKEFPYSAKGKAAAKKEAEKTGMPMGMMPPGMKAPPKKGKK